MRRLVTLFLVIPLLGLVYEESGSSLAAAAVIAAAAGVNYTTFFRHHTGKEELLDDIAAAEIQTLFDLTLPALDAASTRAGALALCAYVDDHRDRVRTELTEIDPAPRVVPFRSAGTRSSSPHGHAPCASCSLAGSGTAR